ncbi:hypothetical protein [Poseidonocella sp. HB161398]|uniref:hypothetical protein n=1 Tax=Poseidonocella sp. HB161398 TaxID=2320855 RepID=UPI0011099498|nr:hypothetical protein [Poseidonocella sp. HB161398]
MVDAHPQEHDGISFEAVGFVTRVCIPRKDHPVIGDRVAGRAILRRRPCGYVARSAGAAADGRHGDAGRAEAAVPNAADLAATAAFCQLLALGPRRDAQMVAPIDGLRVPEPPSIARTYRSFCPGTRKGRPIRGMPGCRTSFAGSSPARSEDA